jgi:hypothetical protein
MVLKAVNVHSCTPVVLFLLLASMLLPAQVSSPKTPLPKAIAQKTPPPPIVFNENAASRMLLQLSESLQGHSQKQFLALFDLSRMKNGPTFRQQIGLFFSQTEAIRVHLNLVEVVVEGERATATVDAEMDLEPRNGGPAARRNEQLNFVASSAGGEWKFIDLQPRGFFSLP